MSATTMRLGAAALGLIVALGPAQAAAEPAAGPRAAQRVHEVKPGDTLTSLAKRYGVTVAAIVKANKLSGVNPAIKVGQHLAIPASETATAAAHRSSVALPGVAAAPGVVVTAGSETRYGLVVKIEHTAGFMTVYAHNDVNLVEVGDRVDAGDLVALVGNTGRATTYHVHFEVRRDGLAYNPLYLLPMPPRIAQVDEIAKTPHE